MDTSMSGLQYSPKLINPIDSCSLQASLLHTYAIDTYRMMDYPPKRHGRTCNISLPEILLLSSWDIRREREGVEESTSINQNRTKNFIHHTSEQCIRNPL